MSLYPTLIHGKHCSNSNNSAFTDAFMEENNRVEQCVGLFEKTVPVTFFIVGNIRITYVGTIFESKINTVVTHKFNSVGNIPSYTVGNMRNEIKTNVS